MSIDSLAINKKSWDEVAPRFFSRNPLPEVSAIFGIGPLIGSLILSKMKIQNHFATVKYAFIIVAVLLLGFTLPVYFEMTSFFSMIYLAFIGLSMALVFQFVSIPMSSFMQKTVPDDYKGRVFSINSTLSMVLMPIGTLIYGFLYQRGIYFPVNLFSAIIIIVTVVLTLNTFTITKSAEEYNG